MTRLGTATLALILASAGCGGKPDTSGAVPESPTAAVRRFLEAVQHNDIVAMGNVWGDASKGPANAWFKPQEELQKRLITMKEILRFERYTIDPAGELPGNTSGERIVRVRLSRNNCRPLVPFTLAQSRGGWLVVNIDLAAAGNPARPCP